MSVTQSEPNSPTRSLRSYGSTDTVSSSECFICMEKTEDPIINVLNFDVARSCQCEGKLHSKCYANWLRTSVSCPICRTPIPMDENVLQQENYQRRQSRVIINTHDNFTIDRLPNYVIVQHARRGRLKVFCEYMLTLSCVVVFIVIIIHYSTL